MFILNIEPVVAAFIGVLALSLALMHDSNGLDFRRREESAARRRSAVASH